MATDRWLGSSGDWSTPANWSTDAVPGPSDEAVIAAPGSYTVTVSTSESVGSVLLNDAGAVLDIQSSDIQPSGTLAVSGPVMVRSGTLKIVGPGFNTFDEGGILTLGASLDIKSGGILFLDGGTIEGGTLIVRHGGTLETSATAIDAGSSVLKNVTVLGGLTLNSGSLLFSGTTTVENSNGTGPGEITLNVGSRLFLGENYTFEKLNLKGGVVAGGGGNATVGIGGLVQGYGQFFEGQETAIALYNQGTINANIFGQTLYIGEADGGMYFQNDGLVKATHGGIISINFNDPDAFIDPWSNNADGVIAARNGTLQLGGNFTNNGLISAVNSTVYFGDQFMGISEKQW